MAADVNHGIREHGMAAAMNGMAPHSVFGHVPVFSDISVRPWPAALMGERRDPCSDPRLDGLGEDGPTHQPVEHVAALRAIPNLNVFRPCDTVETLECWQLALEASSRPSVLALTRQNLPQLRLANDADNKCANGAYEISKADGEAKVSIFASGSEVSLAVEAQKLLATRGIPTRVVSVPCMDLLLELPADKRAAIIGKAPVKVAVEAAIRQGWDAIIGSDGISSVWMALAPAPLQGTVPAFRSPPRPWQRPRRPALNRIAVRAATGSHGKNARNDGRGPDGSRRDNLAPSFGIQVIASKRHSGQKPPRKSSFPTTSRRT